ncbi:uncharacterized protein (DUF1778 family) [Bradyrhizobium sp. USDA 4341]
MAWLKLKTTEADKRALVEAATVAGMSLSAFLRSAAVTEAYRILGKPRLVYDRDQSSPTSAGRRP